MAQQADIDNLVTAFNESVLAIFFPNIGTDGGQALLASLAEYVIDCYPNVLAKCPNIWFAFATHKIALILVNWPIEITDTSVIVSDPQAANAGLFLKSRTIGGKKCEWQEYKNEVNQPGATNDWKLKADRLYEKSQTALMPIFGGGGSCWPDKNHCTHNLCGCERPNQYPNCPACKYG